VGVEKLADRQIHLHQGVLMDEILGDAAKQSATQHDHRHTT
jgi:hypothetical protein